MSEDTARPLKTRQLMNRLQDLCRRGYGDDYVKIEVGGAGLVNGITANPDGVSLQTDDVA